jgi:integrase
MAVKVRRKGGKWYVFVDWHGTRKARCVGVSREAAEGVRREIEKRLALGTFSLDDEAEAPTLTAFAKQWMGSHVRPNLKRSTIESYEGILNFHLVPRFGRRSISAIARKDVKAYLAELVAQGKLARNTIRNIFATLRAMLAQAVEDGLLDANPAVGLGRLNKPNNQARKAEFLTRQEAERFLTAAKDRCPGRYPLFLTALRAGLRQGELVGLQWDDIQFGETEDDPNRYLLIRHNIVRGEGTSPKNKKPRRVDLSRELRQALMALKDEAIFQAVGRGAFDEQGQPRISRLAFASEGGGPLDPRNLYHRDFLPCLEAAGLRRITFHALRHTFASLLIQSGASLAYVKEQMGHSSIQVTVDIYGHLIPGGNIQWIDGLDGQTTTQPSATQPQPAMGGQLPEYVQVIETIGRPGEIRTPDPRFRKPLLYPSELQARICHPT